MNLYRKVKRKINKLRYEKHLKNNSKEIYKSLLDLREASVEIIDNKIDSELIGFSKDRAIQLHAFISSYLEKVKNSSPLNILYTASTKEHEESYNQLISIFSNKAINFIKEVNFREQILFLIQNLKVNKVIFFCDDYVVTKNIDLHDITKFNPLLCVPSLMRGLDWTYCFAFQKDQELPQFIDGIIPDSDKSVWIWKEATNSPDWEYPLTVAGHLFSIKEMQIILNFIDFKAPNSLESNLQYFIDFFNTRYGICYNKTVFGSTPANLVNTEVLTNETSNDLSSSELLQKWNQGFRIKYENYYGENAVDIQNSKFDFVKR